MITDLELPDDLLRRLLGCLGDQASGAVPALLELSRRLMHSNADLWQLEDRARAEATDAQLGRVKRSVDELNSLRAQLVSDIDQLVAGSMVVVEDSAPLSSSVGTALDRLTVAVLRAHVLSATRDSRAARAQNQLDDLWAAVAADWIDLQLGRRRLPCTGVLKRYSAAPSALHGAGDR